MTRLMCLFLLHLCKDRFDVFVLLHPCKDRFDVFVLLHLCKDRFDVLHTGFVEDTLS